MSLHRAVEERQILDNGPGVLVPALLSLLAASTAFLVLANYQSSVRAVVVAAFILLAPGWTILHIWNLARGWIGLALVVALSVSIATVTPLLLLYAGAWSPDIALFVLACLTLAANVGNIVRHHCLLRRART